MKILNWGEENTKLKRVLKEIREIIKRELLCYDNESDEHKVGIDMLEIIDKGIGE